MKRVRKPDDPEKRKTWGSRKTQKLDLEEAKALKKRGGVTHHVGCVERGRRAQIADERKTHPVYRVLNTRPWTPAIRPALEAEIREYIIKTTGM